MSPLDKKTLYYAFLIILITILLCYLTYSKLYSQISESNRSDNWIELDSDYLDSRKKINIIFNKYQISTIQYGNVENEKDVYFIEIYISRTGTLPWRYTYRNKFMYERELKKILEE